MSGYFHGGDGPSGVGIEVEFPFVKLAVVLPAIVLLLAVWLPWIVVCASADPDCQNQHGPYLYAYWKHRDKKLKKRYVGKNLEDFQLRKTAKAVKLKPSVLIKFKFIEEQANKGNIVAKQLSAEAAN